MAVAVDGTPEGRPARRGRELLPVGLTSLTRRATSADEAARSEESERVLRAAVEALLALARRTPNFDVTVTVNQAPARAVRLHYTHAGLVAHRLNGRGRAAGRQEDVGPVLDESEVVSELASMLLAGEVETR